MDAPHIDRAISNDPEIRALLSAHPFVDKVEEGDELLRFWIGDWERSVRQNEPATELKGLVEMIDNNPMVCANDFSLPSPLGILTLIGLGPLVDAGLLLEAPIILSNLEGGDEVETFLADIGWSGGAIFRFEEQNLKGAGSATIIAEIATPDDPSDLDALYEERFGRSFYVRNNDNGDWDVSAVLGTAEAHYRLRLTEDQPRSLLRVQVMADSSGKLGRLGVIHAMNVMAGFEESLGIPF